MAGKILRPTQRITRHDPIKRAQSIEEPIILALPRCGRESDYLVRRSKSRFEGKGKSKCLKKKSEMELSQRSA